MLIRCGNSLAWIDFQTFFILNFSRSRSYTHFFDGISIRCKAYFNIVLLYFKFNISIFTSLGFYSRLPLLHLPFLRRFVLFENAFHFVHLCCQSCNYIQITSFAMWNAEWSNFVCSPFKWSLAVCVLCIAKDIEWRLFHNYFYSVAAVFLLHSPFGRVGARSKENDAIKSVCSMRQHGRVGKGYFLCRKPFDDKRVKRKIREKEQEQKEINGGREEGALSRMEESVKVVKSPFERVAAETGGLCHMQADSAEYSHIYHGRLLQRV